MSPLSLSPPIRSAGGEAAAATALLLQPVTAPVDGGRVVDALPWAESALLPGLPTDALLQPAAGDAIDDILGADAPLATACLLLVVDGDDESVGGGAGDASLVEDDNGAAAAAAAAAAAPSPSSVGSKRPRGHASAGLAVAALQAQQAPLVRCEAVLCDGPPPARGLAAALALAWSDGVRPVGWFNLAPDVGSAARRLCLSPDQREVSLDLAPAAAGGSCCWRPTKFCCRRRRGGGAGRCCCSRR